MKIKEAKNKVLGYILKKNKAVTKKQIQQGANLKKSQVDRACTELRKDKILGIYYRKWWGIRDKED